MTTTFLAPRASTKDAGDTASVNSDWVPWMEERDDHTVHEYLEALDDIRGTEFWFPEQEKLHQLCWLRGHHPVLQKSWEFHFLMYRLPQTLYTPKGSKKRVAISSKTCDFRAAKALEPMFMLTAKIADLKETARSGKTAELIVSTLRKYIDWAVRDAGVSGKEFIPTVEVYHYPSGFGLGTPADEMSDVSTEIDEDNLTFETTHVDYAESELTGSTSTKNSSDESESEDREDEDMDDSTGSESEAPRHPNGSAKNRRATEAETSEKEEKEANSLIGNIEIDIRDRIQSLADRHRIDIMDTASGETPPVLFAYAVIHNFIMVVCLDGSDANGTVMVLDRLSLSDPSQWLWNALSLVFPIQVARDALHARRDTLRDRNGSQAPVDLDPDA